MLNPNPDKYGNINMVQSGLKGLLCESDFAFLNFELFTLPIRKVYKYRKFGNFRMFPSDPKGSLDVFTSIFIKHFRGLL